jgi:antitoxin component of MazEF toxin-antitoxin module
MAHSLIQVGNSKAIIIPARIIKKRKYDNDTQFDIVETAEGLRIVQVQKTLDTLSFPKVSKPVLSAKVKNLHNAVVISAEEIESDERLKYILSR